MTPKSALESIQMFIKVVLENPNIPWDWDKVKEFLQVGLGYL
jgi:hypothetical protein